MFSFLCIFPCEKYTFILVIITCTFNSINFMLKKKRERYHVPLMLAFYLSIELYALAHKVRSWRYIRRGILLLTISLQSDFYCR